MRAHNNEAIENRFLISLLITFIILVGEVIGGMYTSSLALLSDAAHVFMDMFALALSFVAMRLSARPPDDRHTYGYHRLEVLAALTNGITLALIAIGICAEAIDRWINPRSIRGPEMLLIAVLGLLLNLVVARLLSGQDQYEDEDGHKHNNLNVRSAFLHVVGDALSSIGVIIAAAIIWATGLLWLDPLVSLLIAVIISAGAYRILRSSLHILIEGTPEGLSLAEVGKAIGAIPGIVDIHDLHVWNICSDHVSLSVHVILDENFQLQANEILVQIKDCLYNEFGIEHTTIQMDEKPCEACNGNLVPPKPGEDLQPASSDTPAQGEQ